MRSPGGARSLAAAEHVPKGQTGTREFGRSMLMLQADLIRCHFDAMSDAEQMRAVETLAWIEEAVQ